MIGRSGQDGHGAIQLLGQHGPRQGVGPGLGAEGEGRGGGGADALVQPVGAADGEDQPPLAAVPEGGDVIGEGAAGEGLAALVAGDQAGTGRCGRFMGLKLRSSGSHDDTKGTRTVPMIAAIGAKTINSVIAVGRFAKLFDDRGPERRQETYLIRIDALTNVNLEEALSLNVFPNPVKNQLWIESKDPIVIELLNLLL